MANSLVGFIIASEAIPDPSIPSGQGSLQSTPLAMTQNVTSLPRCHGEGVKRPKPSQNLSPLAIRYSLLTGP